MNQQFVEVKAVTWNKDSHGLFDYENNFYDMKKFQLVSSQHFFRFRNDIINFEKTGLQEEHSPEFEPLISITKDHSTHDKFYIDVLGESPANQQNSLSYLIVRSLKQRDGRN